MIKTDKIINELSKYDNTTELFNIFEDVIKFYVLDELQKEKKQLSEKQENLDEKINQINSK